MTQQIESPESVAAAAAGSRATRPPRPPVEEAPPPRLLVRGLNGALRRLLRSPLHWPLSRRLMLLIVTGRKTGRTYAVPLGCHHHTDGELLVSAMGSWRENLRGGAPVGVVLDGRTHAGYAELEEDPDQVAGGYKALLDELGRAPREVGLKVNLSRSPTVEELKPALTGRRLVRVRLDDLRTTGRRPGPQATAEAR